MSVQFLSKISTDAGSYIQLLFGKFLPLWSFFTMNANVSAKKRGAFEALTCLSSTKIATKNKPCGNHCPPHVFLGAVVLSYFSIFCDLVVIFILLVFKPF